MNALEKALMLSRTSCAPFRTSCDNVCPCESNRVAQVVSDEMYLERSGVLAGRGSHASLSYADEHVQMPKARRLEVLKDSLAFVTVT